MKYYQVAIIALLIVFSSAYKNTTSFWQKQLDATTIDFQAYSGKIFNYVQDINKLIGTIAEVVVECSIIYLEPVFMML